MGICAQCKHFRRVKPPSQLLAAVYSINHAEVSQALNKIVEDENKQRDEENQYKRAQAKAGTGLWTYRPVMADFCGLNEQSGEYYIAEIRNAGLKCKEFSAEKPVRHACQACAHRVPARGSGEDQKGEELYAKMMVQAIAAKSSTGQSEALLKGYREGAAARKAFELNGIYSAKGVVPTRPAYADHCGALTTPDEFVVCVLQNPHHTCGHWQQAAADARAQVPSRSASTVSPPSSIALAPVPAPQTDDGVLVAGPVPLTRHVVQSFVAALSWILDVVIPPDVERLIEAVLVDDWRKEDQEDITATLEFAGTFQQVSAKNVETRDAIREEHQAEVVAKLRRETEPFAVALVQLYDAANAPIAMGNPPLTREIANCYFDLIGLLQALQHGLQWHPLPDHVKLSYVEVLASQYPSLPPAQQTWFGRLPRGWTALRAEWTNTATEARERMRQEILASLGAMANAVPMLPQPGAPSGMLAGAQVTTDSLLPQILTVAQQAWSGGLPQGWTALRTMVQNTSPEARKQMGQQILSSVGAMAANAVSMLPQAQRPVSPGGTVAPPPMATRSEDLPRNQGGGEETIDSLLSKMVADDKEEEERLAKENPAMAFQAKLHNRAVNAQLLSNVMAMRHEMGMTFARNIR